MDTRLTHWINAFAQNSDRYQGSFGSLDETALNWKTDASSWSIAQVIDHLIRTNESYFPIIERVAEGKNTVPLTGRFRFISNLFGSMLLKSLSPDRKRKTTTFPVWEPATSKMDTGIVSRFLLHHNELLALIRKNESLLRDDIIISSPANKFVVYSLPMALDILVAHEIRHYNQAIEVLAFQKGTQF